MKALWIIFAGLVLTGCGQSSTDQPEKSVEEIIADTKITNSEIIRNPVSADEPEDTINVAKMFFEQDAFDFGQVNEGEMVTHVYKFTNTGKVPLLISGARSTCGCTVPEWPRDPIAPGGTGEIEVKFNTENKAGPQSKPVTIVANTYPSTTRVMLTGIVAAKSQ